MAGDSSSHHIKGYLPVRLFLPSSRLDNDFEETFLFVKEHKEGNSVEKTGRTLFVANVPLIHGVRSSLLLQTLLGRFGSIRRITLIQNPRKQTVPELSNISSSSSSSCDGALQDLFGMKHKPQKFAHVVFASAKELRRSLKALKEATQNRGEGIRLEKLEFQMLKDETDRQIDEERNHETKKEDMDQQKKQSSVIVVAARCDQMKSRAALLEECNEIMREYEASEERQRLVRLEALNKPDEDGFITVGEPEAEKSKNNLETANSGGGVGNRRRSGQKRSRQKKRSVGASELSDFYRFQRKETRKRTLQELRKQFEEDLIKVKKMKEERQYKPF